MRWVIPLAALTSACGFHAVAARTSDAGDDAVAADDAFDAPADAPPDAAAARFCPTDAHLRMCFTFDELSTSLPEQGAATMPAQLTNVPATASPLGGAAQLGSTSEIYVPMDSAVSGILASEIWFRVD